MFSVLENTWVVGIGGGLISGIMVYIITKFIDNKKGKKEYWLGVNQANKEIITTLQPYVADNGLPQEILLSAIISSVARKHNVYPVDLYTSKVFAEELIRDMINNIYVTKEQKQEYTVALISYIKELEHSNMVNLDNNRLTAKQVNKKTNSVASLVAALVSGIATILSGVLASYSTVNDSELIYIPPFLIVGLILGLLLIVLFMSVVWVKKKWKNQDKDNEN